MIAPYCVICNSRIYRNIEYVFLYLCVKGLKCYLGSLICNNMPPKSVTCFLSYCRIRGIITTNIWEIQCYFFIESFPKKHFFLHVVFLIGSMICEQFLQFITKELHDRDDIHHPSISVIPTEPSTEARYSVNCNILSSCSRSGVDCQCQYVMT